jgi:ribosomal protein L24E
MVVSGVQDDVSIALYNRTVIEKMDGIWNVRSVGRIYTFCILKCSENFKD